MIIKEIHIEGFGKFKNYDLKLEDGLNIFNFENGYGKTTIADFIETMLYGIKSSKKSDKEMGLREKYYPFDNSNFGGYIIIKTKDNEYRIERTFDKKSETKDTLKIYDKALNDITDKFTIPGIDLFEVDVDSYRKTIYLSDSNILVESTNSIENKLSNVLNNTPLDSNYNSIIEKLQKKSKEIDSKSKNAKIIQINDEIKELKDEILNLEQTEKTIEDDTKELINLNKELDSLNSSLKEENEKEKVISLFKAVENYEEEINELNLKKKELETTYPFGFLTSTEILSVSNIKSNINTLQNEIDYIKNSSKESLEFEDLKSLFSEHPYDSNINHDMQNKAISLKQDLIEISSLEDKIKVKKDELNYKFLHDEIKSDILKIKEYKNNYDNYHEVKEEVKNNNSNNTLYILLGSLSIVSIIFSLVFKFTITSNIPFIIFLSLGLILGIITLVLYLNKNKKKDTLKEDNLNELKPKDLIKQMLKKYSYSQTDTIESYYKFLSDYDKFIESNEEIKDDEIKLTSLKEKYNLKNEEIKSYLEKYKLYGTDYITQVSELDKKYSNYKDYSNNLLENNKNIKEKEEKINKLESSALELLKPKNLSLNIDLTRYERDKDNFQGIRDKIIKINEDLKKYKEEHKLSELPQVDLNKKVELQDKIKKINLEISSKENEIDDKTARVNLLDAKKARLEELNDNRESYLHEKNILDKTILYLNKSKDIIVNKYVGPIKEKYEELTKNNLILKNLKLKEDFTLKLEANGSLRDSKHLSQGQYSLSLFALRLSLVSLMYTSEKPFIILDDPFIYLDQDNIKEGLNILNELKDTYQIIYFTCHDSRK